MARMIPGRPVQDAPESEVKTFHALARLDDAWTVLHSVKWQSVRGRRQGDGEADFVLLHPKYGVLVLEVKGGGIQVNQGVWTTTNRHGVTAPIKSPFEQGVASKHALIRFLSENFPAGDRIGVGHAVVLPDIQVDAPLGIDAPLVLTIDSRRLGSVQRAVDGIVEHWGSRSPLLPQTMESIIARLKPTLEVRRLLRDDVHDVGTQLLSLTAQQIRVLGGLRRNRRARIIGGAGTGKTVLAVEKAREYGSQGLATLLTCFNEPVAAMSARALESERNVVVRHFHSLCMSTIREAGMSVPDTISDEWWLRSGVDVFVDALGKVPRKFDAIVVDEGQDFTADWVAALSLLLSAHDDSPFYVFMDSHQDLYVRDCAYPTEWPVFELTTNCRNTLPIATRVAALYNDELDTIGVKGPEPVYQFVKSEGELIAHVEARVHALIEDEKIQPSQLAVLCGSRALVTKLRSMIVGNHVFCEPGRRGIGTETVWRFKGLEAPVVVLALPTMLDLSDVVARSLVYVGLSRPHAALFVVAATGWKDILAPQERGQSKSK